MTETCSGSAKPEKAPAELGTDKAELARESSELFVKCKKGQEGKTKTQRQTSSGKEVHIVAGVMEATTQTYGCYTGNKTKSEMTNETGRRASKWKSGRMWCKPLLQRLTVFNSNINNAIINTRVQIFHLPRSYTMCMYIKAYARLHSHYTITTWEISTHR